MKLLWKPEKGWHHAPTEAEAIRTMLRTAMDNPGQSVRGPNGWVVTMGTAQLKRPLTLARA